jgi:hypothetical protein
MRKPIVLLELVLVAVIVLLAGNLISPTPVDPGHQASRGKAAVTAEFASLPLVFEANQGQVDPQVKFLSRGRGYTLFLTPAETVLALHKRDLAAPPAVLRMKFLGARAEPVLAGEGPHAGRSNYFTGKDPSRWRTNIPHYSGVRYSDIYSGVDLVYYGNPGELEYDLVVAPGASHEVIHLAFEGAENLRLDAEGNLVVQVAGEEIIQRKPRIYQERNGARHSIPGDYKLADGHVRFDIPSFDSSLPLVIDPVLTYSTYLGGSGDDRGFSIAVDSAGHAYVSGSTRSDNFPVVGALQAVKNPGGNRVDAFVAKLDPSGSSLIYSTFLGGAAPGGESANGIAIDASGAVYITGQTDAPDFPTVNPLQATFAGGTGADGFVAKISASGSALLYSTYLGGTDHDAGSDIAVDANGNAYVTGTTLSTNFPTASALQAAYAGGNTGLTVPPGGDAFVAKLNGSGSALVYSTYLGGSADDFGSSIAVDSAGHPFVTGFTLSTNFPTANAFQAVKGTKFDAFVARLDAAGSSLIFSTFLGGNGLDDQGFDIAVSASGDAYVTGTTTSTNFPTTPGAFQLVRLGSTSPFVTSMSGAGAVIFSTYLGTGFGHAIAMDATGNSYVLGSVTDGTFPMVNPLQAGYGGGVSDTFVAKLNPSGSALVYSTFLGGSDRDMLAAQRVGGIAVDAAGSAYLAGVTRSANFPTTSGAFQASHADGGTNFDAFVAKITDNRPPVADAGEDRVVACQSVAGTPVTLDGSGSSDLDNNILSFLWTGPFPEGGGSTSGESPMVTLALGTSTISLVVNDGQLNSPADSVSITVKVGVTGLLPPLEPLVPWSDPVLIPDKAFKHGRTLPLKLQLSCGTTALTDADVAAPRIVSLVREGDAIDLETIDPDAGAANDNGLMLRYSAPNWIYNLSTQGLTTGTYVVTIETPDGLRYSAAFVLR